MGDSRDLTGMQFGKWTVLKRIDGSNWLCECGCENHTHKKVRTYSLISGSSKPCGCSKIKQDEYIDKTFGYWKVLEKDKARSRYYICKCTKCNQVTRSVFSGDLKSGKSTSCGCLAREIITGQTFGQLKVLRYIKEMYKYKCKCSCNSIVYATKYDLQTDRIKSCGKHEKYIDLTDKKFGEWTALSYAGDYKWNCRCSCGT